jgi:hypothetical protein
MKSPIAGQAPDASVTFVVRVRRHGPGQLSGVVERVRTGEKRVFRDGESLGALIGQMVDPPLIKDGGEEPDRS